MQNETSPAGPLKGLPVWVSDSKKTWPSLRIAHSVPLGRLEWLWKSRGASIRDSSTSARAIFEISNTSAEPIPELQGLAHEWYRNPYVYILVLTVNELDDARDAIAWERIRFFLDECREELHEYLIVVAASDVEVIHQRRIIEKLRTEVNLVARGRKRVVIVPPASIREEMRPVTHLHHSPSHQDLLVRLRECMRDGVEARIRSYEDEVSRSYFSKSTPSWLFTKYFALKEGMAFVFVQLGRRDLAVKLYDELYVTMTEASYLSDRKFCAVGAAEAARGIASPDESKYRALLVDDSATELDMRTYLFASQISLLLVDRKFSDVAERGLKFVTAVVRRCAEEALKKNNGVSASFKDTWVFTTARALAVALAPAIPSQAEASHALSTQLSTPRERHTARLIAGFHVHALKAFLGLAHVVLPGCLSGDETAIVVDREMFATEVRSISDEKLNNALSDRKKAELLHSEIANAAASLYEMGGRARGAAALDGDAGMVCMRNKSHREGESLLAAQCSRFSNDNGWDELHRRPRLELLKAEKELGRVQEYLVSCLTMLYMTRKSRRLTVPTRACPNLDSVLSKADVWMQETRKTTAKLPRVMKYRADRLFDVYVRPNSIKWNEGDIASATVEIKSDLAVSITVDRVTMDCKYVDVDDRRKSAFLNRSESSSSSTHPKGNQPDSNNISSNAVLLGQEKPENFTLCSDEKLAISPGVSLVHVASDEVPRSGLFKVTSIAIFMDNLKLVQAAARVPMHPVVVTKNDIAMKPQSPAVQPMLLADLVNCEVRFPIFVASRRKPSAYLFIESRHHLYLAPQSIQYVHVRIQAGDHGIMGGSRLSCSLLYVGNDPPGPLETLVQFADHTQSSLDDGDFLLPVALVDDSDETFGCGEAVIDRELGPHETMDAKIAVHVSSEVGFVQHQLCSDPDKVSAALHAKFSCRERDGNGNRFFSCEAQGQLSFFAPLKVSGHTQMYSSWGSDTVHGAVGLDGTPLTDGGSLLCLVTSVVSPKDTLTLKKVSLETPFWLELRPNEEPAHDDLLPTQLGRYTSFGCIFDILGREQESPRYQRTLDSTPEPFEMDAMQRRLSRTYESSSDLKNYRTDSQDWKYRPPPDDSSSEEGLMEQVTFATQNIIIQSSDSDDALVTRDSKNKIANQTMKDTANVSMREAEDVVDLSTPGGHNRGRASVEVSSPMVARGHSLPKDIAILRLYVEISGVKGVTCLKRKISMEPFRTAKKRYKVERSFDKVGRNGNLMELRFQVGSAGERRTYYDDFEEGTTLQFEVDADPQVWLVVGRRRGKLRVRRGVVTAETVCLIPLMCGWHHTPCLRLFAMDGQALPFSRYENVDECKDVIILPRTAVISGCAIDLGHGRSGKSESTKGNNMPVVIASDSFFKP